MNKVELKDKIFIEGFDRLCNVYDKALQLGGEQDIAYKGETSEIPEELAKKCVEYYIQRCKYKNYNPNKLIEEIKLNGFNYATQSIQSACSQEFCIIYKTN